MISINKPYYIKQLDHNPVNSNRYIYFSGFEGEILLKKQVWEFNFDLYINSNFNLPKNTIYLNFDLGFVKVNNLEINLSETKKFPDYIKDKTSCNLYKTSFLLDLSDTKILDNLMINYKFESYLKFGIDTDILNNVDIDLNPNEIVKFISEVNTISSNSSFCLTNYYNENKSGETKLLKGFKLVNDNSSGICEEILYYTNDFSYVNLSDKIRELLKIKYKGNFVIDGYKVTFNYSIDGMDIKTLEYKIDDLIFCTDEYQFNYLYGTKFNTQTNEIENFISEDRGFLIPKKSIGYFEIKFALLTDSNKVFFKFTKSFNFTSDPSHFFNIKCENVWIDNLSNFNEIEV